MDINKFKLNEDKTEFFITESKANYELLTKVHIFIADISGPTIYHSDTILET